MSFFFLFCRIFRHQQEEIRGAGWSQDISPSLKVITLTRQAPADPKSFHLPDRSGLCVKSVERESCLCGCEADLKRSWSRQPFSIWCGHWRGIRTWCYHPWSREITRDWRSSVNKDGGIANNRCNRRQRCWRNGTGWGEGLWGGVAESRQWHCSCAILVSWLD